MIIDLKEVVDEHIAAHAKQAHAAGMVPQKIDGTKTLATLTDIIGQLRAKGITLASILGVVGPILAGITAGTPAGAIITSILALLQGVGASGS